MLDNKLKQIAQLVSTESDDSDNGDDNGDNGDNPPEPDVGSEGFSVQSTTVTLGDDNQLGEWSDAASAFYGHPGFDPTTGTFTVQKSGRYAVSATINYTSTASIQLDIGSNNPAFSIRDIDSGTDLIQASSHY